MSRTVWTSLSEFPLCFRIPNCEPDCQAKVSSLQSAKKFQSYTFFNDKPIQDILKKTDFRWIQSSGMWHQCSMTGKKLAPPYSEQNMEAEESSGLSIYESTRCHASEHSDIHSSRGDATNTLRFSLRLINPSGPVASEPTVERSPVLLNEIKFVRTAS